MSRAQNFPHRRLVLCLLALLFLPISGRAAECDDLDIQITTTPVFPQFTLGLHQHFEQMRQIPTGPIDLLLVGDSLVWGWDPHAWGKGGEAKSIWGFGAVGDRTQNVLWRLQGDDLKKLAPKNVLLLIGTNNLGAVDKPCAVLAGFEAIVHRMRELWSPFRLLIVLIPPRGENWQFLDTERNVINNELQRRSNLEDWNVIDADSVLTCGFKQPCENYNSDFLHLSSAGYRELSSLVARALGWAN